MQMFDQVHQEQAEVKTMDRKHKDLLDKIGSDGINRMLYEYYYTKNQETLLGEDSTLVPNISLTGVAPSNIGAQTSYRTSQKHHLVVTGHDSQVLKPPNELFVYVDNQEKKQFLERNSNTIMKSDNGTNKKENEGDISQDTTSVFKLNNLQPKNPQNGRQSINSSINMQGTPFHEARNSAQKTQSRIGSKLNASGMSTEKKVTHFSEKKDKKHSRSPHYHRKPQKSPNLDLMAVKPGVEKVPPLDT